MRHSCMQLAMLGLLWRSPQLSGMFPAMAPALVPLHLVEHWTGSHFEPGWLFQAGVEMYLGHNGMACPRRTSAGPSRTQSGFASGRGENLTDMGGLEEDEDIVW